MWSGFYPARLALSSDYGLSWSPLKKVGDWGGIDELDDADGLEPNLSTLLTDPADQSLLGELSSRLAFIETAVSSGEGYREAFADAAKLGPAVDQFFTDVFVMADDAVLRRARLRLVKRVEQLIVQLADVSELVQES